MSGFENLLQKFGGADVGPAELPPENKPGGLEQFIQKFAGVTESYFFYNGEVELRFSVEDHIYYRVSELGNLIPVDGVTNTCGIIDKSMMLVPWASKMCAQKMLRLIPTEMVDGAVRIKALTLEEFTVLTLEAKGAHKEKLEEASDTGHAAHAWLEEWIKAGISGRIQEQDAMLNSMQLTDERAVNAVKAALRWMKEHRVEWLKTEEKVYSREHNYAGTMDGLAYTDSCDDLACCPEPYKHSLSLVDWKTSNQLKDEYCLQTSAYQHALAEELGTVVENRWVLRLGKSEEEAGKFEPWFLPASAFAEDFSGFLACLRLTRIVESISERMKKQKSSIRAVKKVQKETAKALAKEAEKLAKALDKAEKKRMREEEKQRIKAEAKVERERLKAEKKLITDTTPPNDIATYESDPLEEPCTSTDMEMMVISLVTKSDTTLQAAGTSASTSTLSQSTPQPETQLPESITSTAETMTLSPGAIGAMLANTVLSEAARAVLELAHVVRPSNSIVYEEEIATEVSCNLPME
jgi:hypothetical protein